MKSLFRCPVCGGPLDREERVYRCADRHSYDIAKEGYTYLLPPNQKHSADPGDDKAMSAARRDQERRCTRIRLILDKIQRRFQTFFPV